MSKLDDYKSELAAKMSERIALEAKLEIAKGRQRSAGREVQDLISSIKELKSVQDGLKAMVAQESKVKKGTLITFGVTAEGKYFGWAANGEGGWQKFGSTPETATRETKKPVDPVDFGDGDWRSTIINNDGKTYYGYIKEVLTSQEETRETKVKPVWSEDDICWKLELFKNGVAYHLNASAGLNLSDLTASVTYLVMQTEGSERSVGLTRKGLIDYLNDNGFTKEPPREVEKPVWSEADIQDGVRGFYFQREFELIHVDHERWEFLALDGKLPRPIFELSRQGVADWFNKYKVKKPLPQEVEKPFGWTAKDIPARNQMCAIAKEGIQSLLYCNQSGSYSLNSRQLEQRTPYGVAAFLNSEGFKPGWLK
jgi:hypothetical protein